MKWQHALLASGLSLALLPAAQAKVTSATLYPSHAQMVWEESQTIEQGSGELTVSGLPLGLQDQTLIAGIEGLAGLTIQQVRVRQVEQADVVAQSTRELREQLRQVEQRIGAREDEIQAWNQQITLMTEAAKTPGEVNASELASLAETVQATTDRALKQVRDIRQAMFDDVAERDRLKRELAASQQNARATKQVTVSYQANSPGQATLRLDFQSSGANWYSQYNARLASQSGRDGTVVLEHLAVIRQTTGVDWSDVQLTLSTANPRRGTNIPPVTPWVVTPGAPNNYRAEAAMKSTMDALQMEAAGAPQSMQVREEGAFTQSYRVPTQVTLKNDRAEQVIAVGSHRVAVSVETRVFPAMDLNGFVHASGTFEGAATLPSGSVTLYRDGQSVGQTRMDSLAPGSELAMGFGVNDRLTAERTNEENQKGEQGVFKGEKYARRANRYDITNHHSKPIAVRVYDRLPVSQQDDLTVEALTITEPVTRGAEDTPGLLVWERTIEPSDTLSLKAGFEVRVPEDSELPYEFQ